ncbi:hypothetical protein AB0D32_03370 [Micromonospora sp. NPDC048170]
MLVDLTAVVTFCGGVPLGCLLRSRDQDLSAVVLSTRIGANRCGGCQGL